jgi:hypothetical protein
VGELRRMKWEKKGLVCSAASFDLPWYRKNTMVPVPHLRADGRLRIFITMCDEANVGRIGYVDVDPADPSRVLGYSREPVLAPGEAGSFSDNGVLTASLLKVGDKLYMYYSAYQACVKVPYLVLSGVAVSTDDGETFTNLTRAPLLDRVEGEIFLRSAPVVMPEGEGFRVWYTSDAGSGWVTGEDGRQRPCYDIKHLRVGSPTEWPRVQGTSCIPMGPGEHGIAKGALWKEGGLYRMIFSVRSLTKGYRLGYAESADGERFVRKDDEVGIDVSASGWDSEMIAFPERFEFRGRTYLFYCGNHYGMGGMGYAELTDS